MPICFKEIFVRRPQKKWRPPGLSLVEWHLLLPILNLSHSTKMFTASSPNLFFFFFSYQPQSGLISRVTDTVKSIVPSWLQKYFKNGDVPEEGGAALGAQQNCLGPQPPPNGSEEGPPSLDGRDSPEPSTSNAGERLSLITECITMSWVVFFFVLTTGFHLLHRAHNQPGIP